MIKPAAGYRPLAYSSPEAVQTTGTVVRPHTAEVSCSVPGRARRTCSQLPYPERDRPNSAPDHHRQRGSCQLPDDRRKPGLLVDRAAVRRARRGQPQRRGIRPQLFLAHQHGRELFLDSQARHLRVAISTFRSGICIATRQSSTSATTTDRRSVPKTWNALIACFSVPKANGSPIEQLVAQSRASRRSNARRSRQRKSRPASTDPRQLELPLFDD
jgi:hypothetical protein